MANSPQPWKWQLLKETLPKKPCDCDTSATSTASDTHLKQQGSICQFSKLGSPKGSNKHIKHHLNCCAEVTSLTDCLIQLCLFAFLLTCWCSLAPAVIDFTRMSINGLHMICNNKRSSLSLSYYLGQEENSTRKMSRDQQHLIWKSTTLFTAAL